MYINECSLCVWCSTATWYKFNGMIFFKYLPHNIHSQCLAQPILHLSILKNTYQATGDKPKLWRFTNHADKHFQREIIILIITSISRGWWMTVKFSLPLSAASHILRTLNAIYKWINGRNFPYRILFALIIAAAAAADAGV